jgi:hypothetical protein
MENINILKKTHKKSDYATLHSKLLKGELSLDEKILLAKIIKTIAIKKIDIPYVISSNYHFIDLNEKDISDNF